MFPPIRERPRFRFPGSFLDRQLALWRWLYNSQAAALHAECSVVNAIHVMLHYLTTFY